VDTPLVFSTAKTAPQLARALVERSLEGAARRDDSLALVLRHRGPAASWPAEFGHRGSPDVQQVPLVRHGFNAWVRSRDEVSILEDELAVVISELVTNAVRMATRFFEVRATVAEGGVVIEVQDDGPGFDDAKVLATEADFDDESGRGLFIVKCMVDELEVRTSSEGSTVRVFKKVPQNSATQSNEDTSVSTVLS